MKFFETLLNGLKAIILSHSYTKSESDAKYGAQPDWNESDTSSHAHIKNRPFYEETSIVKIVDNLTYSQWNNGNYPRCNFVPGQKYDVVWNGTLYEVVCRRDDNYNVLSASGVNSPFYIDDDGGDGLYVSSNNGSSNWTLSITGLTTHIEKIPEKYLPNVVNIDDIQEQDDYEYVQRVLTLDDDQVISVPVQGLYEDCLVFTHYTYYAGLVCNKSYQVAKDIVISWCNAKSHLGHQKPSILYESRYRANSWSPAQYPYGYSHCIHAWYDSSTGDLNLRFLDWSDANLTSMRIIEVVMNSSSQITVSAENISTSTTVNYLINSAKDEILDTTKTYTDETIKSNSMKEGYSLPIRDSITDKRYIIMMKEGQIVSRSATRVINITTPPNNTNVIEGGVLDTTGMIVTATLEDGNIAIIENNILNKSVATSDIITITYEEAGHTFTDSIKVTIIPLTEALIDFDYTVQDDGTYLITGWKGTLNGEPSDTMVIPNSTLIVL